MPDLSMTQTTRSPEETRALGRRIGAALVAGDILALTGDLGSGKTCLIQGIADGLEVPDTYYVTSPSYTLINEYPGRLPLFHVDLYRIVDPAELEEIGFFEILSRDGAAAIEWADRFPGELPSDRLDLHFSPIAGEGREIRFKAGGHRAHHLLKRIENSFRGN
jgi:tRNA threonylcarbamoyladenosine biosynthesis protein TsaE